MITDSYYYPAYDLTIQAISFAQETHLEPQIELLKSFSFLERSSLFKGYYNENKLLSLELEKARILDREYIEIEDESDRIFIATMPQAKNMLSPILLPNQQCLVGYAPMGVKHPDKKINLFNLHTRANLGVPIGSALIAHVLDRAIETGYNYPIETAAAEMPAYLWYRQHGFKGRIMHMQLLPEKFQATRQAITEKIGASQLITTPKLVL